MSRKWSWNGHPKQVRNFVIKRLEINKSHSRLTDDDDIKKIWLDLPCNGKLGEKLVTSLIKKLKRCFKENINIVVKYKTNKLCMFCPTNDRISWKQKTNTIYISQCSGCHNDYVDNTDRNIITRLSEHVGKRKINSFTNIFGIVKSLITNQIFAVEQIF